MDSSNAFTLLHADLAFGRSLFGNVTKALEGAARPSFSAHVRWGEHGAPVQNQRLWWGDQIRQSIIIGLSLWLHGRESYESS
jgi:hypothetical protein